MEKIPELSVVLLEKEVYDEIVRRTNDPNKDLLYTDKDISQMEALYSAFFLETGYTERTVAIIDGMLYELPEDWREIVSELEETKDKDNYEREN